jgi:type IV secretion system protein VirB10
VQAGDIIEGALLTTLNSDLPGVALAQVTRDVFDHASGQTLLIPHGSRIFGHYDSRIGYGQNRASVLWDRIVMPNGSSVELKGMIGADDRGASGLSGSVDDHIGPIARAIGLSTVLVTGAALAQNAGSRSTPNLVLNDAQGGAAAAASEVGGRFVERDLNRKPTITVPSGWPVLIVVDKDLEVRPYQSGSPAGEPRDAGVSRPNPRDQALRPRPVAAF